MIMVEPWFDPIHYSWIPGTVLGIVGGIEGSLVGVCASKGLCRRLVLGFHFGTILACFGLFVCGLAALLCKQPYGVWYGLGLPGLLGLAIFGSLTPTVFRSYRDAELRRAAAQDL